MAKIKIESGPFFFVYAHGNPPTIWACIRFNMKIKGRKKKQENIL